jgi:hypothetical protein
MSMLVASASETFRRPDDRYDRWPAAGTSGDPESIRPLITRDFVLESPTTRHT